jgi:two-component system, OmpR family, response regulator VicR
MSAPAPETAKATVLYVEDDRNLAFMVQDFLQQAGYNVVHAENGNLAWQAYLQQQPQLCILDVMLPELDGFSLAERIRQHSPHVPIIFLSAKGLKEDKLYGLKLGGDDYLTKPFNIEELLLKVEIFLRRNQVNPQAAKAAEELPIGQYVLNVKQLSLSHAGASQKMTLKEAMLLQYLRQHSNQVLRREEILQKLWQSDDYFLGRSLDVFVSRLRKYLAADPALQIENVHGVGFRFVCPE